MHLICVGSCITSCTSRRLEYEKESDLQLDLGALLNHGLFCIYNSLINNKNPLLQCTSHPTPRWCEAWEWAESQRGMFLLSYNCICSLGLCISSILSIRYADLSEEERMQTNQTLTKKKKKTRIHKHPMSGYTLVSNMQTHVRRREGDF